MGVGPIQDFQQFSKAFRPYMEFFSMGVGPRQIV
jgi:hypothetical protein